MLAPVFRGSRKANRSSHVNGIFLRANKNCHMHNGQTWRDCAYSVCLIVLISRKIPFGSVPAFLLFSLGKSGKQRQVRDNDVYAIG